MSELRKELVSDFVEYLDNDIASAINELETVKEPNRKHLQKLVYVDVANRFDSLVDALLVSFATDDSDYRIAILRKMEDPILQRDVFSLLLDEDPRKAVIERIKKEVSLNYLSLGHNRKLWDLLRKCCGWEDKRISQPSVEPNKGAISTRKIRKHPTIPNSIVGYADWLYRRRNVLVHRDKDGRSFTIDDIRHFKKHYDVKLSTTISIKLASIKLASKFYKDICLSIMDQV